MRARGGQKTEVSTGPKWVTKGNEGKRSPPRAGFRHGSERFAVGRFVQQKNFWHLKKESAEKSFFGQNGESQGTDKNQAGTGCETIADPV